MSLPPEIIQVKRLKRKARDDDHNDEGVVDYLRVDGDRKRYRSDAFIYQRSTQHSLPAENDASRDLPRDVVPVIHSSKPGEENKSDEKGPGPQTIKPQPERMQQVEPKPKEKSAEEPPSATARATPKSSSGAEPRRFHFSRPIIVPSPLLNAGLSATGKRSRHNTPTTTVFVERGHKRTRTEDVHMKDADAKDSGELHEPPRKLKLPGSDRKSSATGKPAVPVKKEIPASMNKHWTTEMDEITRNMNDFALQLIGENLAKIEERDKKEAAAAAKKEALSAAASPQASRFKPKVPAKRYAERHPEVAAVRQQETESTTEQDEYETGSEDEYVVETYVRVPASSLGKDINPGKVGLLVFDNEPDVDFFYAEEGDSDDEWAEDEEDENAENYYTADYPDEEVDSDDEFDRAAYYYRTGNASDLEEFDERDEDDYALDHGDDNDEAPVPLSAYLGLQPPNAFQQRRA